MGFHCCTGFPPAVATGAYSSAVRGLLTVPAPSVVEQASAVVVGVLRSCGSWA